MKTCVLYRFTLGRLREFRQTPDPGVYLEKGGFMRLRRSELFPSPESAIRDGRRRNRVELAIYRRELKIAERRLRRALVTAQVIDRLMGRGAARRGKGGRCKG